MEPDDRTLVERCLAGDERAFALLLRRYKDHVFSLVRQMVRNSDDAAEITQDAFVRAFHALPRFDPQYTFRAWILKIASNLSIDFLRKKRLPTVSIDQPLELQSGDVARDIEASGPSPEEIAAGAEAEVFLQAAFDRLSPAHRQVLLLLYKEKMSYDEIAGILEEPLGTIKARIHRARESLRTFMAPYLEDDRD